MTTTAYVLKKITKKYQFYENKCVLYSTWNNAYAFTYTKAEVKKIVKKYQFYENKCVLEKTPIQTNILVPNGGSVVVVTSKQSYIIEIE